MTTSGGVVRKYKHVTHRTYDSTFGLPISVQDDGDPVAGSGPTCDYTTYARNTDAWIADTEATELSATGACPTDGSAPTAATWTDRTDTYYDADFTSLAAAPSAGLATKVLKWASGDGAGADATSIAASKYDSYGRVVGMIPPDNFVRDATSFDTAGRATTTAFSTTNGVLTGQTVTGPTGQTSTVVLEPGRRQPTSTTDQNGRTTSLTYDPLGRLTNVRMPGDGYDSKTFSYDVSNTSPSVVVTSEYPAAGASPIRSWTFYDSLARVFQEQKTTATGTVVTEGTRFDDRGNDAVDVAGFSGTVAPGTVYGQWYDSGFISSLPSQTVRTYDATNREVTSSLVSLGVTKRTTTTRYDGPSTTTTPPSNGGAGQVDVDPTTTVTDFDDHVLARIQGSKTVTYGYNESGDLTKIISPEGVVTTYTYDWLGRRTSTVDPNAGATKTDYYPSGAVKYSRDAKGNDLFTAQDELGRPTATYAGTNAGGALLSQTVYDGVPLDGGTTPLKGTVTSETAYVGSVPGTPGTPYTQKFGYDARYHVTRTDQIIPGAVGAGLGGTYTTNVTYDGLGRQTSTSYPAAGGLAAETVTTGWSGAYPTTLTGSLGGGSVGYVSATGFTGIGQVASRILGVAGATGSVQRVYTWDPATGDLLTQAAATPSANATANLQNDTYTYSATGDVTKTTDAVAGQQQCYTYDSLDRLTKAFTSTSSQAAGNGCTADSTGPAPYNDSYAYDGDANLTSLVHNGAATMFGYGSNAGLSLTGGPDAPTTAVTPSGTTTYSYDAAGQLTSRVSGSTTTGYGWDSQDHLVSVTTDGASTARFAYGPDDERWVRSTPGETVVYLAGQELHLAAGASVPSGVRYYDLEGHTVASRSNATAATSTSGTLSWILSDRQDSASLAVEAATGTATRDRYLPYGGNRATTTGLGGWTMPNDRGWLGQVQDKELGLDYLQARYYDPVLAHFVSTDPFNVQDDPQSANPYGYAAGNPVTFQDPNGLWPSLSKAWNSTASWVSSHKDTIAEVGVGLAVGLVVVGTGGIGGVIIAGAIAGAAGASAGYGVRVAEHKETFSAGGLLKAAAGGAAQGAVGGALGAAGGKLASAALKYVAKPAIKAAVGAGRTAPRALKASAAAQKVARCGHSFDPRTPVVMADGTTKPIGEIIPGDSVVSADPATGETSNRDVVDIHNNNDYDLAEVNLRVLPSGSNDANPRTASTITLSTTLSHPFYVSSEGAWEEARHLKSGDQLLSLDGQRVVVAGVTPIAGHGYRRDLTVSGLHTYYVRAGSSAILVHNCELSDRADELHSLVTGIAHDRSTTAVVKAIKMDGSTVRVVARSGKYTNLTAAQQAALRDGEVAAKGSRVSKHAEDKALDYIASQGWKADTLGSSRPICRAVCLPAIKRAGGRVTGSKVSRASKVKTTQRKSATFKVR